MVIRSSPLYSKLTEITLSSWAGAVTSGRKLLVLYIVISPASFPVTKFSPSTEYAMQETTYIGQILCL